MAIPVSYVWVKDWLQNFAYRVDVSPVEYVLSLGLVTVLLLVTISFQTLKSTSNNPAHNLRDE